MPDYQIHEWNEENYNVNKCTYIAEAYNSKKWAFVADYARFDILNQYGGLYFDTDVELLKPIPDMILSNIAFTGFESAGYINPGLVFGTIPQLPFLSRILDDYNKRHFIIDNKMDLTTINSTTAKVLLPYGLKLNNTFQIVDNIAIYPSDYFCGFDQDVKEIKITDKTISVHHYAGTWTNKRIKNKIRNFMKSVVGVEGYRKLLRVKRKLIKREL